MGSFSNFRNFNDLSMPEGSGEKTTMDIPLIRQSSIYSLTFDEFQTTLGGLGKDYGSMNMDELLKNIWTAEETQVFASSGGGVGGGGNAASVAPLQKQGSLTLPRTLSQKTVDDVWKDLFKDYTDFGSSSGGGGGSKLEQRQTTLGETTLEEFLMRAGVVREDNNNNGQVIGNNNNAFYGGLSQPTNNNAGLSLNFQLPNQNNSAMYNQINENVNSTTKKPSILPFSIAANTRHTPQQLLPPQPIFPKQTTTTTMAFTNNHEVRSGPPVVLPRINNIPTLNNSLVQGGPIRVNAVADSPLNQLSPDVKSCLDTPSYSPPSFTFNGGAKGRKCGASLEKAMERRHKRMIKNRESAARSRERKQAYTLELEAEIAKLKEINQQLQKEQEEIMEAQKNKLLETVKTPSWTGKRVCLRRTLTGPW